MFRRSGSLRLMTVFGIRIGVDASWFIVLFLLIFTLSGSFRTTLHSSDGIAYLTTVVSVLLLFASLILHELGHAIVARRQGIEVKRIDLFLFGGLTRVGRDARTPGEDFKIAVAGPVATLAVILVGLAVDVSIVGPHRLLHAILLADDIRITPVLLALSWLVPMNILLLVFNIVPAFPLDGGRIARSVVWRVTGDKARGTRAAARLGQGFAVVLAGLGLWLMLSYGSFSGLWLLALAYLLGQAARGAVVQSALGARMEGVRVADIMDGDPVSIPLATPVTQALDEYLLRYRADWLPVVDQAGHVTGIATTRRAQEAYDAGEGWITVGSVIETPETSDWRVDTEQPISELLGSEALPRLGALVAVDAEGTLQGMVTLEQLRRALQSAFGAVAAQARR